MAIGFIAALIFAPAAFAQSQTQFVTNGYFTFGDPDGRTASVELADFDNDGDLDVFAANGRHWAQQDYVYLNNGTGRMLTAAPVGETLSTAYRPAVVDLDNDGDMDIVSLRDRVHSRVFMNRGVVRGVLRFEDKGAFGEAGAARSVSIADIDQNGRLDALVSQRSGRNYVVYNLGRRDETLSFIDQETESVRGAVADFNNDGFQDAVFANLDEFGSYIVFNDGAGQLTRVVSLGAATAGCVDARVADLENDGDDDIILGCWRTNSPNHILINDGGGHFSERKSYGLAEERTFSVAVDDLNGDGLIDIVTGNMGQPNNVYLAKGDGTFARIQLPEDETANTYGVAIGDLNNDGRPDLVFSNSDSRNRIYMNVAPEDAQSILRR